MLKFEEHLLEHLKPLLQDLEVFHLMSFMLSEFLLIIDESLINVAVSINTQKDFSEILHLRTKLKLKQKKLREPKSISIDLIVFVEDSLKRAFMNRFRQNVLYTTENSLTGVFSCVIGRAHYNICSAFRLFQIM